MSETTQTADKAVLNKLTKERDLLAENLAKVEAERETLWHDYNNLLREVDQDASLPDLTKPEEGGTRSFGRQATAERLVHVERIDFSEDIGYVPSSIHRRAVAAVTRALGGNEDVLPELPTFGPERSLTVFVEVA